MGIRLLHPVWGAVRRHPALKHTHLVTSRAGTCASSRSEPTRNTEREGSVSSAGNVRLRQEWGFLTSRCKADGSREETKEEGVALGEGRELAGTDGEI